MGPKFSNLLRVHRQNKDLLYAVIYACVKILISKAQKYER